MTVFIKRYGSSMIKVCVCMCVCIRVFVCMCVCVFKVLSLDQIRLRGAGHPLCSKCCTCSIMHLEFGEFPAEGHFIWVLCGMETFCLCMI